MQEKEPETRFILTDEMVTLDLSNLLDHFGEMLTAISDFDKVAVSSLIFYSNFGDPTIGKWTIDRLITSHVRPLDYVLAKYLQKQGIEITWKNCTEQWDFTQSDYAWAILSAYLMLMTRDKLTLSDNEVELKIIRENLPSGLSYPIILKILTANNVNKMDHEWIFQVKADKLGEIIKSRLMKGLAGSRLLYALINYPYKSDISSAHKECIEKLKSLLSDNVYIEQHTRRWPKHIKNMGFSKNLNNFIIHCFDKEVIQNMVKDKAIYKYPSKLTNYNDYLNWDSKTFDYLKTKLFKD